MKTILRTLILLCMVLLLVTLTTAALAAEDADVVVYIDNVNGKNTNDGLTEAKAVKTVYYAYTAARDAMAAKGLENDADAVAKFVFVTDYKYTSFTETSTAKDFGPNTEHVYRVVMEGKTPDVSLQFYVPKHSYLGMVGPTTIQNLNIRISDDSENQYLNICGRGGSFIIGEGVTTSANPDKRPILVAGPYYASSVTSYLEVNSGDWRNLYAGTYNKKLSASGKLVMNGGTAAALYGTYTNTVTGDIEIILNDGKVQKISGTSGSTGVISGKFTVTLNGGTVTGSVLRTGSGKVSGTKKITVAGDDVKLLNAGSVTLTHITASTLNLGSATRANFINAVTGPVKVNVDKRIRYDYAYITAPSGTADDAFTFSTPMTVTDSGTSKVWKNMVDSGFTGLVLKAPEEFTFTLYSGLEATTVVEPDKTEIVDGIKCQYYANIIGNYCYVTKRTGYYTVTKALNMSEEKSITETVVDVSTGKREGIGWEPTSVTDYTDEIRQTALADDETTLWWNDYGHLLVSPYFTDKTRAEHRQTTQAEMEDFIASLDDPTDNMYVFSAGKTSVYKLDIPVVIFTKVDLSDAKTLEEAAALIRADNKAVIHYQAQIHGNEPAGGEAALNTIARMDSQWGDGLLDTINVLIVPRVNPDGAKDYTRDNANHVDLNRDMVLERTEEVAAIHRISNLFEPDVNLDGHEYNWSPENATGKHVALQVSNGINGNYSEEFIAINEELSRNHYDTFYGYGLQPGYYANKANSYSAATNSGYHSTRGTMHILMESRGIGGGNYAMGYRVVAHMIVTESVFEYVAQNHEAVTSAVDAERTRFATIGATYEEDDVLNLYFKETIEPDMSYDVTYWNNVTGEVSHIYEQYPIIYREAEDGKTRPRPTAYVFPAGETWNQKVLDVLDANGISYYIVSGDKMLKLRQMTGVVDAGDMATEYYHSFPNGCYVVPMNQPNCLLAAYVFEPDICGSNVQYHYGSVTQVGIMPAGDNCFPVYYYVHDLEADGAVATYTGKPAPNATAITPEIIGANGGIGGLDASKTYAYRKDGSAEFITVTGVTEINDLPVGTWYIRYVDPDGVACKDQTIEISYSNIKEFVVYVDSTAGDDTNAGFVETAPLATIEGAVAKLSDAVSGGAEGATGKVILLSNYELGKAAYTFPSHSFHITYTAKTSDIELIKGGGTGQAEGSVNVNGPSTFEHLTLTLNNENNYGNFNCRGFRTVIGEGVTCKGNATGRTYMLSGGNYSGNCGSTDLTVLSGYWNMIYGGGYRDSVEGDVKLVVNGASLAGKIMASFTGGVTGNITYDISNVTCNGIYLGTAKNLNIEGNITAIIREGVVTPFIYAANRDSGAVVGTSHIIVDGADLSNAKVCGLGEKAAATVGKSMLTVISGKVVNPCCFDKVVEGNVVFVYQGTSMVAVYGSFAEAAKAAEELENAYLKLGTDVTEGAMVAGGLLVDLNGHNLSGITVDGVIYCMDSTTDHYTCEKVGTLTLEGGTVAANIKTTVAQTGAVHRYMAISDGSGYTFHRFYLAVTHQTLRPATDGVGYKAVFYGDDMVLANVTGFGFNMQLGENAPKTVTTGNFVSGKTLTLRIDNYDVEKHGETKLYASAVLKLKDGTVIESTRYTMTLRSMLETLNEQAETLTGQQLAAVAEFIKKYAIISTWKVENLV